MASKRIRVMISSRCADSIRALAGGSIKISDLRLQTKQKIEDFRMFGRETFDCWVHEDQPTMDGSADIWDHCLDQVRRCDILLVLYNGNAGWATGDEQVGICHAELAEALRTNAAKVRVIDIQKATAGKLTGSADRNRRFAEYIDRQELGRRFAANEDEALRLMQDAVQDAVASMVHLGLQNSRGWDTGAPLDWTRLDYTQRKAEMERVLKTSLRSEGAKEAETGCVHDIEGVSIYFCCHAVPAAMTVAAAREMVGRPFLRDHETIPSLKGNVEGPVHVIACNKGVTENQAVSLLGFPDATIVTPAFGVYVADNVQKIQIVFLANCRDESSTRYAVQRFFDWLARSGEASFLAARAKGRKAIISTIAGQISVGNGAATNRAGR
jgi:hypothetical protein